MKEVSILSLIDKYSVTEFEEIVKNSYSYKECLFNLGYHANSGSATQLLKKRIKELNIDTSHFTQSMPQVRNEENIFIENSTADQSTLRRWYKKGNYTQYKCSICGQEPFWNGKELTLILDHINGHNKDDRIENLRWVCPNCNQQLDTTNGKNKIRLNQEINLCVDCGKKISKSSVRCNSCESKRRAKVEISKEELKQLIRTTPFTHIGKQFGVSDNAIRKWCEKYGLPKRASDIKNISDDDWEKI